MGKQQVTSRLLDQSFDVTIRRRGAPCNRPAHRRTALHQTHNGYQEVAARTALVSCPEALYAETELSEQEVPVAVKKAAVVNYLSPRLTMQSCAPRVRS
jgi:hypothetical protein